MEAIETIEYRGFNIEVHYDEFSSNPRKEFTPLGKIVCQESRSYTLGDEQANATDEILYNVLYELGAHTEKMEDDFHEHGYQGFIDKYYPKLEKLAIVLPVDFYDYGSNGCKMSISHSFDEGSTGLIYISKNDARKEYGRLTKKTIEKIVKYMTGEVKEYSSWLSGEVYGYTVEPTDRNKSIDCNDSCWGFYGETDYMISEAKSNIDYAIKEYKKSVVADYKERKEYQFIMYMQAVCN